MMVKPTPPFLPVPPLVGSLLEFYRDRYGLLRRGLECLGPIFGLRLGPKRAAVLVGPEHSAQFFRETDNALSMDRAYRFIVPMFGEPVGFVGGPEVYRLQRPIYGEFFKASKMARYVRVMGEEVHAWIATMGEAGEIEVVSSFEALTRHVAAHAFLGRDFRFRMGDAFWALFHDLVAGIDPVLPAHLPLPRFLRRDRAKRQLHAMLVPLIRERRASPGACDDLLQGLVEARYKDGRLLTERTVIAIILSLVFAGYETTSGQASWALIQLLQHPHYLARVQAEVDGVLAAHQPLDLSQVKQLPHLSWALKETERTRPAADILLRHALADVEVGDYRIPKGWLTMMSAQLSHQLPQVFPDPHRYDPLRFAPGRAEDQSHRFALVGFGGGLHRCTGMSFAYTEMAVVIASLLRHCELTLITPDPQPTAEMRASRPQPCWIGYRRRRAAAGPVGLQGGARAAACPHARQESSPQ